MARTHVTLLGGLEVRLQTGASVVLPTHKYRALLAFLAVPAGRAHPREKLVALLWDDLPRDRGRSALRQAIFAIRKALDGEGLPRLVVQGDGVALNPDAVWVDVAEFERAAGEGDQLASLERAAMLYGGDFLAGLPLTGQPFEDWLTLERERLRERAIETLARLLAGQRHAGAREAAVQTALRLLALDPLQEPVHRALMVLYIDLGRRAAALRQYQVCVGLLRRELGVEPEPETRALYREMLSLAGSWDAHAARNPAQAALGEAPGATLGPLASEIPFVGRTAELARLRPLVDAIGQGRGHVLLLLGEAGVGKSRLVAELAASAVRDGHGVHVGRCHEAEQILPFRPWTDALRAADISDAVTGLAAPWRVELARLFPEVALESVDPGGRPPDHSRLFEAIARLLARLCASRPLALVLEDVHWADEMSLRLLAFVGRRIATDPVLLVATAREEDLAEFPLLDRIVGDLGTAAHVTRLSLSPLARDETAGLVRVLLPTKNQESIAGIIEETWSASEGNPFVVVELLRALEQGVPPASPAGLTLPERVRSLVARRLARLSAPGRELVALAAVIGRELEFPLLQRAAGLGDREAAGAVEELVRRRVFQSLGEHFEFTHGRIREVAYAALLSPRRALLHRAVAAALEALYAGRLESHHLALGLHYFQGEVWDRAVVHLRRAGARAVERSATREAAACFERALAALAHLPDCRDTLEQAFDIRLELRSVLTPLSEVGRTLEHLREAEVLAERLNDDRRRGRSWACMTRVQSQLGEFQEAVAAGTRALTIARALGDVEVRVLATGNLALTHFWRGEYERAVELATDNLAALPADQTYEYFGGTSPPSVFSRCVLLMSLAELGRFAEAAKYAAEAIRLAEPTHHVFTIAYAHRCAAVLSLLKGDWVEARSLADYGISVLRTGDVPTLLISSLAFSAWALAQLGETSEALNRIGECWQVKRSTTPGLVGFKGWTDHALGRATLLLDRLDEAGRLANTAIEVSRRQPGSAAHAQHLLGDIAIHPNRFDAELGEAHYRQALALAEPRGMRPLVARCRLGLGVLHKRAGHRGQAREHLTVATDMLRSMHMLFWLSRADQELTALGEVRASI